ncbi:hypothetical protein [Desulfomicrobium escambiense]|uniref:hypothetical protein n=1 Tax=Desulfomicrobium escambiense TaxID=29503 RepID=UPI0004157B6B|nr:hypothetical protein [Desulfomicrobium escambiense]
MPVFVIFFAGSLLVGFLGRKTRFGFWGNFFASMLLSPLVGLLLILAAEPVNAKTPDSPQTGE